MSIWCLYDVSDIVQTSYRRWNDAVYLLGNSDTNSTYTVSKWSPVTNLSIVDYGHDVYWELYWTSGSQTVNLMIKIPCSTTDSNGASYRLFVKINAYKVNILMNIPLLLQMVLWYIDFWFWKGCPFSGTLFPGLKVNV